MTEFKITYRRPDRILARVVVHAESKRLAGISATKMTGCNKSDIVKIERQ